MPELKEGSLWRSYDYIENAGTTDPYKLLCSAIIFQAAQDCEAIRRCGEGTFSLERYAKGAMNEMTVQAMVNFINSDWLEFLLEWTDCVTIEGVRENLLERLGVNETIPT